MRALNCPGCVKADFSKLKQGIAIIYKSSLSSDLICELEPGRALKNICAGTLNACAASRTRPLIKGIRRRSERLAEGPHETCRAATRPCYSEGILTQECGAIQSLFAAWPSIMVTALFPEYRDRGLAFEITEDPAFGIPARRLGAGLFRYARDGLGDRRRLDDGYPWLELSRRGERREKESRFGRHVCCRGRHIREYRRRFAKRPRRPQGRLWRSLKRRYPAGNRRRKGRRGLG